MPVIIKNWITHRMMVIILRINPEFLILLELVIAKINPITAKIVGNNIKPIGKLKSLEIFSILR